MMQNKDNDKEQLLNELSDLRRRVDELEELLTAHRQGEEKNLYLASIVESSDDAIIGKTLDGIITSWNEGAEKIYGYKQTEIMGKPVSLLVPPDHQDEVLQFLDNIRRGEHIQRYETVRRKKDGNEIDVSLTISPIRNKEGRVIGASTIARDITGRKRTLDTLLHSQERYKSFIEVTGQLGWITNADGEVEEDIPFWRSYTGQSYEETKGWGWSKALHPDDLKRVIQVWRKAVATKTSYEVEYRLRGHDSGYRYFLARGVPKLKEDGSVREWVGTCIDITERKQAEMRVQGSEEALKSLLNATTDPVLLMDRAGIILAANAVVAQRLGRELDDLIGNNLFDLLPKDLARSRQLWIQKVMESGKPVRFEDASADDRYFDSSIYPVFDLDGKVARLAVYAKDITEVKRAVRALAESEARFKQLFDSVNDGIVLRDAHTFELLDANRRFCEMFGRTFEEMRNLPLGSLSAHESVEERRARLVAYYEQTVKGVPGFFQWEAKRKDGSIFWVELNGTMITIGSRQCLLLVVRDITERKEAEEKIRASLREKEVLLKEVHHRVKNNLQIVSSLLQLQTNRTAHPGAVSALKESRARVTSMARIHERLYRSSNLASVDMGEYVKSLVSDLEHSYGAKGSSVRLTVDAGDISLGTVEAIPCGLIINELVSNSLKYAFPDGKGGEVAVQLRRGPKNSVVLTVRDNGIGLPEHVDLRTHPLSD